MLLAACQDEAWLSRVTLALARCRQEAIKDYGEQLGGDKGDTAA